MKTLEALYKILEDKFWVSCVNKIRQSENKIYQLILAKELGFSIPESILTTSKASALDFVSHYDSCIVKPLHTGLIEDPKQKVIFTNRIDGSKIDLLGQVACCPTLLQEEVRKRADIRVTVVGNRCFSVLIESQNHPDSIVDWRRGSHVAAQKQHSLPESIQKKCLRMVANLQLKFGAIDLVLNDKNEYIFLEINPNGQWGWIEKDLGYDISGEIVDLLIAGKNS